MEADLFRVLADPTRRAMFESLSGGERTASELKAGFAVSQPAISQHLAALRRAGLVAERRAGRFSYYRAVPAALTPLGLWVERYRHFWPDRLQNLKRVLEDFDR
jgi:DNA-binding transcriptional ArsR family regulator